MSASRNPCARNIRFYMLTMRVTVLHVLNRA